jgi:hypothetical protein
MVNCTGHVNSNEAFQSEVEGDGRVVRKTKSQSIRRLNVRFNPYKKVFSLIVLFNLAAVITVLYRNWNLERSSLSFIITASSTNILVAVLARQDYIVNTVYVLCWHVPHSLPLTIRSAIAVVYEHGGIHSGAATSATAWLLVLVVYTTTSELHRSIPVLVTCYVLLLLLLVAIAASATPVFRSKNHNTFERIHRFAGWAATALFWVAVLIATHESARLEQQQQRFGQILIRTPAFWMLTIITVHLILPWLRLRRMSFHAHQLSSRAVRLDFRQRYPPTGGIALSQSPLLEWHPFATFPNPHGGPDCHSIIISLTGDWTRGAISSPASQYWVKGIPKIGLLSLALVFRSVLVVTTGSGIGPSLSLLLSSSSRRSRTRVRVVWSTPDPVATYGEDLYGCVLAADPEAMIIDTKLSGRPDLVGIAYRTWLRSDVEAVFVISNREVTGLVVRELKILGVPAFGPIWDS